MPLLKIDNLHFEIPTKTGNLSLLQDINLSLEMGQTMGIVGESGSGKTTLGRCIVRLYEPTSGTLMFDERDITHLHERELQSFRKNVQFIFQDPLSSLNPRRPVWQLVTEGINVWEPEKKDNELKEIAADLLNQVALPDHLLTRYPHQLSGGQRQRVGIARAVALKPKLIIADEVVSGLDVSSQARILNVLRDLQNRHQMSLIIISHDLSVVRLLCEKLMMLYHGKVVEQGNSKEIFSNPTEQYTRNLIDAIPHLNQQKG